MNISVHICTMDFKETISEIHVVGLIFFLIYFFLFINKILFLTFNEIHFLQIVGKQQRKKIKLSIRQ